MIRFKAYIAKRLKKSQKSRETIIPSRTPSPSEAPNVILNENTMDYGLKSTQRSVDPEPECSVCQQILEFLESKKQRILKLEESQIENSMECKVHNELFSYLSAQKSHDGGLQFRHIPEYGVIACDPYVLSVYWKEGFESSTMNLKTVGRRVDQFNTDLTLARRWKEDCDQRHSQTCSTIGWDHTTRYDESPTWLVDITRKCLVPGSLKQEYVALSYVWGDAMKVTTQLHNLEKF